MRFLRSVFVGIAISAALVAGQVCQLVVPATPLTAAGLSSPWILQNAPGDTTNDCNQALGTNSAFVEAVIFDTSTGAVSVYRPLVVNSITQISIQPVAPAVPANGVVGVWVSFNGNSLTLVSTAGTTSVADGNCVNMGTGNTQVFGNFAYCNAPAVFGAMQNAVLQGTYVPPTLGNAPADGLPCPSSRDILVVDQNPSTGIAGSYIVNKNGLLAQDTLTNQNVLGSGNFTTITTSLSNNHNVLNNFLLPALGCGQIAVTDAADPNKAKLISLAVNEIIADMQQAAPQSVVSRNSPMAQVNAAFNLQQLNAYRAGVNQPSVQDTDAALGLDICMNFGKTAVPRLMNNQARLATFKSPNPAQNMFNYMIIRMNTTFMAMNCAALGVTNPTTGVAMVQNNFPGTVTTNPGGGAAGGNTNTATGTTTVMGLPMNAVIGIGVGAGIAVLGGATVGVYYLRKRVNKPTEQMLMDQFL